MVKKKRQQKIHVSNYVRNIFDRFGVFKTKACLVADYNHLKNNKKERTKALIFVLFVVIIVGIGALFFQYRYVLPIYDGIELPKPPEIVFYPDAKLSFGLFNDSHTKTNRGGKHGYVLSQKYAEYFKNFFENMKGDFAPDFFLGNGDIIDGTYQPADEGVVNLKLIRELFDAKNIPAYWVIGNHDLRSVTRDQWKESLGIDYLDKAFEIDKYKIIVLDSQFSAGRKGEDDDDMVSGMPFNDEQKRWLEKELSSTRKIPIIFMHNPPFNFVQEKPCGISVGEVEYLQKLFARYHVAAVFAGHIEKKYYEKIDGVHYFVIPGFYRSKEYFGTFAQIEFKRRKPTVKIFYSDASGNEHEEVVE